MKLKQAIERWAGELAGLVATAAVLVVLNLLGRGAFFENRFLTGLVVGAATFYLVAVAVNALLAKE